MIQADGNKKFKVHLLLSNNNNNNSFNSSSSSNTNDEMHVTDVVPKEQAISSVDTGVTIQTETCALDTQDSDSLVNKPEVVTKISSGNVIPNDTKPLLSASSIDSVSMAQFNTKEPSKTPSNSFSELMAQFAFLENSV